MGRCLDKNTFNNLKSIVREPNGSTTTRPEQPNTEEAEESTLKMTLLRW